MCWMFAQNIKFYFIYLNVEINKHDNSNRSQFENSSKMFASRVYRRNNKFISFPWELKIEIRFRIIVRINFTRLNK